MIRKNMYPKYIRDNNNNPDEAIIPNSLSNLSSIITPSLCSIH